MKKLSIVLGTFVLGLVLTSSASAEVDAGQPLSDTAFDSYVDTALLQIAIESKDSGLMTDVALQFVEGERVLLRSHSTISAEEVLRSASKLAVTNGDEANLNRLIRAAKAAGKTELAAEFANTLKLAAASRSAQVKPTFSVEGNPVAQNLVNGLIGSIDQVAAARDSDTLDEIKSALDEFKESLGDKVLKEVAEYIEKAKASIPELDEADMNLAKLGDVSRQIAIASERSQLASGPVAYASHTHGRVVPVPQVTPHWSQHPTVPPYSQRTFDILNERGPRHDHGPHVDRYRGNDDWPTHTGRGGWPHSTPTIWPPIDRTGPGPIVHVHPPREDSRDQLPSGYFAGEQRSSRQMMGAARSARISEPGFQFPKDVWWENMQQDKNCTATMQECQVGGHRLQGSFYSLPNSRRFISPGSPSWNAMLTKGILVGYTLLPTSSSFLAPSQQFFLSLVATSGTPIYFSNRLQLQYIYDPNGPIIVWVGQASPLLGVVKVGDSIVALDHQMISSPWDMESHYRWTCVEKEDFFMGWYWNFWSWLGPF